MITELKYSNTNTYLIQGTKGCILFDTGWAGTFPMLCKELGKKKLRLQDIDLILISHYHPDHMGIAQEIADKGAAIAVLDIQREYIHISDHIFEREENSSFVPINDANIRLVPVEKSRAFLKGYGINGEIFHTPGHSDDSITLWLEREKALFVGDLNPLYELDMHKGTYIAESWNKLLKLKPKKIYYGHAKSAELNRSVFKKPVPTDNDTYALVKKIVRLIDRGFTAEAIHDRTGADRIFIEDVARMYVTHPNVSVQGILDRIEIKGR